MLILSGVAYPVGNSPSGSDRRQAIGPVGGIGGGIGGWLTSAVQRDAPVTMGGAGRSSWLARAGPHGWRGPTGRTLAVRRAALHPYPPCRPMGGGTVPFLSSCTERPERRIAKGVAKPWAERSACFA